MKKIPIQSNPIRINNTSGITSGVGVNDGSRSEHCNEKNIHILIQTCTHVDVHCIHGHSLYTYSNVRLAYTQQLLTVFEQQMLSTNNKMKNGSFLFHNFHNPTVVSFSVQMNSIFMQKYWVKLPQADTDAPGTARALTPGTASSEIGKWIQ